MRIKPILLFLALATGLALAVVTTAPERVFAFDANDLLAQIEKRAEESGNRFTYSNRETTEDGLVLSGVVVEKPDGSSRMEMDELILGDVSLNGPKGLDIGKLAITGLVTISEREGVERTVRAKNVSGTGFSFSDISTGLDDPAAMRFDQMGITGLTVSRRGDDTPGRFTARRVVFSGMDYTSSTAFKLDSVVVEPATISVDHEDGPAQFGFEGLTAQNIEKFGQTGWMIDALDIGAIAATGRNEQGQNFEFRFDGAGATNLYVADPALEDRPLISQNPLAINIKAMTVVLDGRELTGWDSAAMGYGFNSANGEGTGVLSVRSMFLDFAGVPNTAENAAGLNQLRAMGYERLNLNVNGRGSWNPETGTIDVEQYRFDFSEAGSIETRLKLSGYTEEVARRVNEISNQLNTETDPDIRQVRGMEIFAAVAGVAFDELEITIEDASLLGRILEIQAAQTNRAPEELAAMAGPMAGLMLAPFGVQEFAASVSQAINTFMQGNRSITAKAKPVGGLVVTEIMSLSAGVRAGQIHPAEIIERLNLSVSAR